MVKNKTKVTGRPPIPDGDRLVYVSVGLPPALRDAIVEYAWQHRMRIAEVIRKVLEAQFSSGGRDET